MELQESLQELNKIILKRNHITEEFYDSNLDENKFVETFYARPETQEIISLLLSIQQKAKIIEDLIYQGFDGLTHGSNTFEYQSLMQYLREIVKPESKSSIKIGQTKFVLSKSNISKRFSLLDKRIDYDIQKLSYWDFAQELKDSNNKLKETLLNYCFEGKQKECLQAVLDYIAESHELNSLTEAYYSEQNDFVRFSYFETPSESMMGIYPGTETSLNEFLSRKKVNVTIDKFRIDKGNLQIYFGLGRAKLDLEFDNIKSNLTFTLPSTRQNRLFIYFLANNFVAFKDLLQRHNDYLQGHIERITKLREIYIETIGLYYLTHKL